MDCKDFVQSTRLRLATASLSLSFGGKDRRRGQNPGVARRSMAGTWETEECRYIEEDHSAELNCIIIEQDSSAFTSEFLLSKLGEKRALNTPQTLALLASKCQEHQHGQS